MMILPISLWTLLVLILLIYWIIYWIYKYSDFSFKRKTITIKDFDTKEFLNFYKLNYPKEDNYINKKHIIDYFKYKFGNKYYISEITLTMCFIKFQEQNNNLYE